MGKYKRIYLEIGVIICIALLCLLLCLLFIKPGEKVEVHFSPGGNIQNLIISKIDRAQEKVEVAMFAFTSKELAWALIRANNRGVKTRVILDGGFIENEFSKHSFLYDREVKVKINLNHLPIPGIGKSYGKMHNKFAVIDGKTVITGSYNWTASAEERNEENLLIFPCSPCLAKIYEKEFDKIWEGGALLSERRIKKTLQEYPVISASDIDSLKQNANKIVKVYGTVYSVYHSEGSNPYFLHFGPDPSFTAVIFSTAAEKFRQQGFDPHSYRGKEIELLGRVIDHPEYGLEMVLEDPSQIRLGEEKTSTQQYKDAA
ncbi:MAG: phospholipase D family protein [Deltaproteobacteria bacterium]|nr:phospholipase D family protein [Deltaproteobacteria bacterium]